MRVSDCCTSSRDVTRRLFSARCMSVIDVSTTVNRRGFAATKATKTTIATKVTKILFATKVTKNSKSKLVDGADAVFSLNHDTRSNTTVKAMKFGRAVRFASIHESE